MAKKILGVLGVPGVILIPFLLASCISIKQASHVPTEQSFATATLILPTAQPRLSPTFVPDETATPSAVIATAVNCTSAAILLRDVTIPDYAQVDAGKTFIKTWEFQNTGTCAWSNYTLKFKSGDEINAPLTTSMPAAARNERVQVSMELTAPTADGTYTGYFALYDANGNVIPVGVENAFWVKFRVGNYVAVPALSGTEQAPSGNCTYGPNAEYVNQVVSLINAERAQAGLSTLTFDWEIAAFAQSHADEMAYNNFLSHDGLHASFGERMRQYSMTYGEQIGGEILAIGTPQNAMDQWRRDEHWDYVLGAHYSLIGVGYAYNSCSDYGGYFTVDLR